MQWNRESGPSLSSLPSIKPVSPVMNTNITQPPRQGASARDRHDTWVPWNRERPQAPPMSPRRDQDGFGSRYNSAPQTQRDNDHGAAGSSQPRREGFRERGPQFSERSNSRLGLRDREGSAVNQKPHRQGASKPKSQSRAPKSLKRPAPEVYIPSTVPVGTLSKILKVKLGM